MIEIDVTVKGFDEVRRVFQELPREIAQKALRGALLDGAEIMRKEVQARAPKRAFWPPKRRKGRVVMPGVLKRSIVKRVRPTPRKGDITVSVGATGAAFYWHMVEFGHRLVRGGRKRNKRVIGQVAARPFLRPAFAAMGEAMTRRAMARLGPRIVAIARSIGRRARKLGGA